MGFIESNPTAGSLQTGKMVLIYSMSILTLIFLIIASIYGYQKWKTRNDEDPLQGNYNDSLNEVNRESRKHANVPSMP